MSNLVERLRNVVSAEARYERNGQRCPVQTDAIALDELCNEAADYIAEQEKGITALEAALGRSTRAVIATHAAGFSDGREAGAKVAEHEANFHFERVQTTCIKIAAAIRALPDEAGTEPPA